MKILKTTRKDSACNMKRYGNIYEKIYDKENIRIAIQKASKGKRNRRDVKRVLNDIPRHVDQIHEILKNETYKAPNYKVSYIREGILKKERKIFKPNYYPDQIIHWALMIQLGPILMKSMYEFTCGSIPNRGVHYGKRYVRKWLDNDRKNTKYYLKMDVQKFYPSVCIDKLNGKFRRKIKDEKTLNLIALMLKECNGLPIGILISQWFANYDLQGLDYFIKQDLKAKHYIRYMDDMVIFGANKKELHRMRKEITKYLSNEKLTLKGNWQVCKLDVEPLDFMGFRFFRNKTILRKSIMLRITRKARTIYKQRPVNYKNASGMISYMGWVKHSDSKHLRTNWIDPYINIKKLKRTIREESKCRNVKVNQQYSQRA